MPHKHGTHLGGVWSLEDLRARCRIDAHTECWHWSLHIERGSAMVWVRLAGGPPHKHRGRRAALMLSRGEDLPSGHLAWARSNCHSHDCVNPAHAISGTKAEWGAELARRGLVKNIPAKVRASRQTGLKRRALTPEQVQEVKHSPETNKALAARYGVSFQLISEVRRGIRYPETVRGASVFNWRGGAA